MKTTDRRNFLRTSLTGLAGLASVPLLGGLAGCQQVPTHGESAAEPVARPGKVTVLPTTKLSDRVTLIGNAPGNVLAL